MYGMNDRLKRAMRRLADESAQVEAPPGIEAALLAEFDRAGGRRKRLSWTVAAAAIAASVAIVLSWDRRPNVPPPAPAAAVSEDAQAEQPFVPIPYVAPLAPYERAEVVRMELSVSVLIAAGFPMRAEDPGAKAEADVVVGQDGRAQAVRILSISNSASSNSE